MNMKYATLNKDYAAEMALMPIEDDGPIWMVNLMKYRETAEMEVIEAGNL